MSMTLHQHHRLPTSGFMLCTAGRGAIDTQVISSSSKHRSYVMVGGQEEEEASASVGTTASSVCINPSGPTEAAGTGALFCFPPPKRHWWGSGDPLVALGADLFLTAVLPLLDALALARCATVCSSWRACCTADALWHPLHACFLHKRAHIPLPILRSPIPLSPFVSFSLTMRDAALVALSPEEMCARIWEMRVKLTCGTYWHLLDPTSRGENPLLRRFHCDHSVTALQDNDPIWGGQESVWQFVKFKNPEVQRVQINRWPHHNVVRLPDGRWRLDNFYASYTTCCDQEHNKPPYVVGKVVEFCPRCNPGPVKQ